MSDRLTDGGEKSHGGIVQYQIESVEFERAVELTWEISLEIVEDESVIEGGGPGC